MKTPYSSFLISAVWMISMLTMPLYGALTNFVTRTADSGPGTLRQAVADSRSGDVIRFRISGLISLDSGEIVVSNSLNILGPGASLLAISGNNASRVFRIAAGVTSAISGVTIRDGRTTNAQSVVGESSGRSGGSGGCGGGVLNHGSLKMRRCLITRNSTGYGGRGQGGVMPISSGEFGETGGSGGSGGSGGDGGGIYNDGWLVLDDCTLADNACGDGGNGGGGATGGFGGRGGGTGGAGGLGGTGGFGGAICNRGEAMIMRCVFVGNYAGNGGNGTGGGLPGIGGPYTGGPGSNGSGGYGGSGAGIWNDFGTCILTNCIFSGNHCGRGGGGGSRPFAGDSLGPAGQGGDGGAIGNSSFGMLVVAACSFSENIAGPEGDSGIGSSGGNGGAIFTSGTCTTIVSTISGNVAGTGSRGGHGGGIYNGGDLSVSSCTIASNLTGTATGGVSGRGGGIYCADGHAVSVLQNTIVAWNSAGNSVPRIGVDVLGVFDLKGHNLIGVRTLLSTFTNASPSDRIGTSSNPIDPRFGPLQDNGGPVLTHALLAGSPAIDAGMNNVGSVDGRGQPRTIDDPGIANFSDSDGTDIGALEVDPVLRATEVCRSGDDVHVRFTSVSDKVYGVEYKPAWSAREWIILNGTVPGTGGNATFVDTGAASVPFRCYRVFEAAR